MLSPLTLKGHCSLDIEAMTRTSVLFNSGNVQIYGVFDW